MRLLFLYLVEALSVANALPHESRHFDDSFESAFGPPDSFQPYDVASLPASGFDYSDEAINMVPLPQDAIASNPVDPKIAATPPGPSCGESSKADGPELQSGLVPRQDDSRPPNSCPPKKAEDQGAQTPHTKSPALPLFNNILNRREIECPADGSYPQKLCCYNAYIDGRIDECAPCEPVSFNLPMSVRICPPLFARNTSSQ